MLQQHPYLNSQEKIVNKYSKLINLSQQLTQSQPKLIQQPQFEQNYTTPQWQKQMNPQLPIPQPQTQIQTTQSKYIPQPQYSQVQIQQQPPVQVMPQQPIFQPQQQQHVQIINPQQQQQVLTQSSPPRIYKTNQKLSYDQHYQMPPPLPPQYDYYPEPQYEHYPQPQYEHYPPLPIYNPPYQPPPPIYEQPIPLEPNHYIPLPEPQIIDNYFQPKYESQIKNFDNRGNRYQEYPFKELVLKDYFIKALINMATQEEYIEAAKIDVFREIDFRVGNLFSLIDYNQTGSLSIEEFSMGLKMFSLQPDMCDLRLLFLEYGNQERIDIQQFGDMIRPKKNIKNVKAFDEDSPKLLPETKIKIRKLFVAILNAESVYESERQELQAKEIEFQEQLDFEQLFDEIFQNDQISDLSYYLQQHGQYFDNDTIQSLFLRFDRAQSKKISMNELMYGFQPRLKEDDNPL